MNMVHCRNKIIRNKEELMMILRVNLELFLNGIFGHLYLDLLIRDILSNKINQVNKYLQLIKVLS